MFNSLQHFPFWFCHFYHKSLTPILWFWFFHERGFLLLVIRFDGPFTDLFLLSFVGARSHLNSLVRTKYYVDIGYALNIIVVELLLLCLGQIISCDNLTSGKAYGINYGVHVTLPCVYIYIITTFWFLILRTQLAISHTFSN